MQAGKAGEVWGRVGVKRVWCFHQLASSVDTLLTLEGLYLELKNLLKDGSEFGNNYSLMKEKCNVIPGMCKIIEELLN